jgi:ATP-dependent DNA helicase RecG
MLFETTPLYSGGTGTGDMIRRCQEAGLREPKFELADGFTLTLWRARDGDVEAKPSGKPSGIVSGITSGKMSGKIVRLIADKPDITIPELALRLKRTTRAIEMQINRLKADEIIGRVGPAKGGHWEILK